MIEDLIKKYDPTKIFDVINSFHLQILDTYNKSKEIKIDNIEKENIKNIVISGLGGSAIGGDLLRTYAKDLINIPVIVNREYSMPEFVNGETLALISSYSGNTEETISAYKDALKRKAKIICITNGGEIRKLAAQDGIQIISVPPGYQPRFALGFMFFNMLYVLVKIGIIKDPDKDIKEIIDHLKTKSKIYSNHQENNIAKKLAEILKGKFIYIYTSPALESVGIRWRGQLAENAKVMSSTHVFPELNHNEIVAWTDQGGLKKFLNDSVVIFLRDPEDFIRNKYRMDITKEIIKNSASEIFEFSGEGRTLLSRIFDMVYLIDWVSYYLALLNNVDPAEIKNINLLKNELSLRNEWR